MKVLLCQLIYVKLIIVIAILFSTCNTSKQNYLPCKLVAKNIFLTVGCEQNIYLSDTFQYTQLDTGIKWISNRSYLDSSFFIEQLEYVLKNSSDTVVSKSFFYTAYFKNDFKNDDTIKLSNAEAIGVYSFWDTVYSYSLFIKNNKNEFIQTPQMNSLTYSIAIDGFKLMGNKIIFPKKNNFSIFTLTKAFTKFPLSGDDNLLKKIEEY